MDGEIIILLDEWLRGPRVDTPPGRKAGKRKSQHPQPLDETGLMDDQNKPRRLTLSERRGKLSNFWYTLANGSGCLRVQFLDYFNEPQEFRIHIRKDRCCSNCNPDFQLGMLDNHYLYSERGKNLNVKRKKVLEQIKTWAEGQLSAAFPNPSFTPTVYFFISEDQLTQLAKDAHVIANLDSLQIGRAHV